MSRNIDNYERNALIFSDEEEEEDIWQENSPPVSPLIDIAMDLEFEVYNLSSSDTEYD